MCRFCELGYGSGCELREGALERYLLFFAIKINTKKIINNQSYVADCEWDCGSYTNEKKGWDLCYRFE